MELNTIRKTTLSTTHEEDVFLKQARDFLLDLYKTMEKDDYKFIASENYTIADEDLPDVIRVLDALVADTITADGLELY